MEASLVSWATSTAATPAVVVAELALLTICILAKPTWTDRAVAILQAIAHVRTTKDEASDD